MLAKVLSFGVTGLEAYPVEIEVDVSNGLPAIHIVGMADTAIKESRERVKSAIKNSNFVWPDERITINLGPSDTKKEGTSFDLAIALGILAATQQLKSEPLNAYHVLGELCLDGTLRATRGILPISMAAAKTPSKNIIIPSANANEAALVTEINIFPLKTLRETVEFLHDPQMLPPFRLDMDELRQKRQVYPVDFAEVKGQYLAKRAIEVAVSGAHNILMIGPPGSGKTMLAKRIPTIMPELTMQEMLEITKIHSVTGLLNPREGVILRRPFRSPHHTISHIALVGGGAIPQPGEISLAHLGVLFLDELPEFHRNSLEALRQPLEDGSINIARVNKSLSFPASLMLVCAMNPCPCGYYTDMRKRCRCGPNKIARYMGKISGPLLDRIDIHIELPAIKYKELTAMREGEASCEIRKRVETARLRQKERFQSDGIFYNAQMTGRLIKKYCQLNEEAQELLKLAVTELGFSARAFDKILRLGRTIADLADSETILPEHISEAVQYRSLD